MTAAVLSFAAGILLGFAVGLGTGIWAFKSGTNEDDES